MALTWPESGAAAARMRRVGPQGKDLPTEIYSWGPQNQRPVCKSVKGFCSQCVWKKAADLPEGRRVMKENSVRGADV